MRPEKGRVGCPSAPSSRGYGIDACAHRHDGKAVIGCTRPSSRRARRLVPCGEAIQVYRHVALMHPAPPTRHGMGASCCRRSARAVPRGKYFLIRWDGFGRVPFISGCGSAGRNLRAAIGSVRDGFFGACECGFVANPSVKRLAGIPVDFHVFIYGRIDVLIKIAQASRRPCGCWFSGAQRGGEAA